MIELMNFSELSTLDYALSEDTDEWDKNLPGVGIKLLRRKQSRAESMGKKLQTIDYNRN